MNPFTVVLNAHSSLELGQILIRKLLGLTCDLDSLKVKMLERNITSWGGRRNANPSVGEIGLCKQSKSPFQALH